MRLIWPRLGQVHAVAFCLLIAGCGPKAGPSPISLTPRINFFDSILGTDALKKTIADLKFKSAEEFMVFMGHLGDKQIELDAKTNEAARRAAEAESANRIAEARAATLNKITDGFRWLGLAMLAAGVGLFVMSFFVGGIVRGPAFALAVS